MTSAHCAAAKAYFLALQERLCAGLQELEGEAGFIDDRWDSAAGVGSSRILKGGRVLEQAGVNFSHVRGERLPAAASAAHPHLAESGFEALGVSLVVHPRNPHVPISHANLRMFSTEPAGAEPVWWFGGGYDLTPCYGYVEDCRHWHRTAAAACAAFGEDLYPRLKRWCDEYFYLPHRREARGVGGLFFDDLNEWGFDTTLAFVQAVGDSYLPAYLPIVRRRMDLEYTPQQRQFQLYRRGRYVEFNLVHDRGTRFGLQSGGRIESILMSLPPLARWEYAYQPQPDSPEARLTGYFLQARDWLAEEGT